LEAEKRVQRLLDQACGEVKALAPGWDRHRLIERIQEIHLSAAADRKGEEAVPLFRRRRIARSARDLLKEIELAGFGFGTAEAEANFLSWLRFFRSFDGVVRVPVWGAPQSQTRRGGDRRSGLQLFKGSVLSKIVRLYREAHANPRFSLEGPLVRFANTVGELALGKAKPFSSDAVKAEFRREKLRAPRPRRQRPYNSDRSNPR
jgi:hypothetical protein